MFPDSAKTYRNILQDKQLEEGNAEKSEQPEAKRVRQRTGEEKRMVSMLFKMTRTFSQL
jgi:hypothetical protein